MLLDELAGYPLDFSCDDLHWGLLNRYRMDYIYGRGMASHFAQEAQLALRQHKAQRRRMVAQGFEVPLLDDGSSDAETGDMKPMDTTS